VISLSAPKAEFDWAQDPTAEDYSAPQTYYLDFRGPLGSGKRYEKEL